MPAPPTELLDTVEWTGPADPDYLLAPSPDAERFHRELSGGRFVLRTCTDCSRARYPHAPVCPYCGSTVFEWREQSAEATLVGWARSQVPFVPEFPPPYLVVCAELDAGPPMIAAFLGPVGPTGLVPGARLRVVAQRWPSGVCVPGFTMPGVVA